MVASFVLLDRCLTLRAWPALFLNVSLRLLVIMS